jgi:hypothetical protein
VLVSSWSLLIRGILAALRQKFHLSTCPNLASHLSYPDPESEPQFEAEVRMFRAEHREPDAAADRHMVPGVRGNELMDGAASAERLAANDLPSGAQSRADQGDLAA